MRRYNGVIPTLITDENEENSAIKYLKEIRSTWGDQLDNLRTSTYNLQRHQRRKVNKPRVTRIKSSLGRIFIGAAIGNAASTHFFLEQPISFTTTGTYTVIGISLAIDGFRKSLERWNKKDEQLKEQQAKMKSELMSTLEILGRERFTKAAVALEIADTCEALNKPTKNLMKQIEEFDQAVELVCKVALNSRYTAEFEELIMGLDSNSKMLKNVLTALRDDLAILGKLKDKNLDESRYQRNVEAFLPHLVKAYGKICTTRNEIENVLNGTHSLRGNVGMEL